MGDPKRAHKKYSRPRTPFDKNRIDEEKSLMKKYGLKNKREIWRSESFINRIRSQAKKLILKPEQQKKLMNRLTKLGLVGPGSDIDDILALTKEKLLERRFQTIVFKKGLAKTAREARQMIVHKKVKIGDRTINIPGYIVRKEEENKISVNGRIKKEPKIAKKELKQEIKEEIKEEVKEKTEENGKLG